MNFDANYGTLDNCLTEISNPSTYSVGPELLALKELCHIPDWFDKQKG